MKYTRRIFLLTLCLYSAFNLLAQNIPLDTAVHTGMLPNGFTYYIRHNEEPKNRVFLYLVNKIGSVLETDDQQGLAHFMEHMNFNGTTHFPKNDLIDYLQKSGVRFGADLNAYTSFDETVYQLPIPTDNPMILQNGFQIMRDWAQDATLDSIEINKERGVVLEEERLGRGADERMERVYYPILLNHSRYSERLPIGKVDILNSFPPAAIRRFHADWYRPDLQALVVVGDIDVKNTEALIINLFSDLKTPSDEKGRIKYTVPLSGKNQFIALTDKEMTDRNIEVIIKHTQEKLITEENYIHSVQRQLFNQMIEERFAVLSQTPNLPLVNAGAGIGGLLANLDAFSLYVTVKEGKYEQGFKSAWKLVEELKRFGFSETELQRARQNYLRAMEQAAREKDKTNSSSLVGEYQALFLNQEASPGIEWEYRFVKDRIGQITLSQINGLVAEYVVDSNRDILILAPEKDKNILPDSVAINGWINTISKEKLMAYSDDQISVPLLAVLPKGGRIESSKKIDSLGIHEFLLSNGARVILKPTPFKNDEIQFAAFAPGGSSLYSDTEFVNAYNSNLIPDFGLAGFDPVQLNKILNGKIANVSTYIGERTQGIEGRASPKDLETALQLIYLRFTKPRKDSVLFTNLINNYREIIRGRSNDPNTVFEDTVNLVLGNYNYRRTPPTIEKINRIDLNKIYRVYRQRFADASNFTFIFVGNFNPDSIVPLLSQYIGGLPTLHKNEQARDLGIHIPSGRLNKKVFKGSENKATVKMVFSGRYRYSPEANLLMNALKEVLEIKVTQHLREDESEVYSPSVEVNYVRNPTARYRFTFSFGCAPANTDHLMDQVDKEIKTLRDHGPAPEDLDKFKAESRRLYETQLKDNEFWLGYLTGQYQNHENPTQILYYLNRLNKLKPEELQHAANMFLSGDSEIRFELLPETH